MAMLIENTSNQFRIGETEHVPAIGRGPIGNAESGLSAGDQSSDKDQKCSAAGSKEDETVKCNVFVTHERFDNSDDFLAADGADFRMEESLSSILKSAP